MGSYMLGCTWWGGPPRVCACVCAYASGCISLTGSGRGRSHLWWIQSPGRGEGVGGTVNAAVPRRVRPTGGPPPGRRLANDESDKITLSEALHVSFLL